MSTRASAPTRKQLQFLRALAQRTGTTFVYPKTRAHASREIAQLLRRPVSPRLEVQLDRAAIRGGEVIEDVG